MRSMQSVTTCAMAVNAGVAVVLSKVCWCDEIRPREAQLKHGELRWRLYQEILLQSLQLP